MAIRVRCKCGRVLAVDEKHAGRQGKCPGCGAVFTIPAQSTAAPEDSAAGAAVERQFRKGPASDGKGKPEAAKPSVCPNCGREAEPDQAVCLQCGARLGKAGKGGKKGKKAQEAGPEPVKTCPKCGREIEDPKQVICMQCGANLQKAGRKGIGAGVGALTGNKAVLIGGGIGLLLLLGLGVYLILSLVRRAHEPSPPPPQAVERPVEPGPAPEPEPPKFVWTGYADTDSETARRVWTIWQAILACREKNGAMPVKLAELTPDFIAEEEVAKLISPLQDPESVTDLDAAYAYTGTQMAATDRRHVVLYDRAAIGNKPAVTLFSDGSIWRVTPAERKALALSEMGRLWVTPAERRILASFQPRIRITNDIVPRIRITVDDTPRGSLDPGQTANIQVSAGVHTVKLTGADGKSAEVKVKSTGGLMSTIRLPRNMALPAIPLKLYSQAVSPRLHRVVSKRAKQYQLVREGRRVVALRSENDTVVEVAGKGIAVDVSARTLRGVVRRPGFEIRGLEGGPIRVSPIQRLSQGVVVRGNGSRSTHIETALGTVIQGLEPDLSLADKAFLRPFAGRRPWLGEQVRIAGLDRKKELRDEDEFYEPPMIDPAMMDPGMRPGVRLAPPDIELDSSLLASRLPCGVPAGMPSDA